MLAVTALCFSFEHKKVFDDLNLSFPHRRQLLTGENGLGKTTLFALVSGLYSYTSGVITWRGTPITQPQRMVALSSPLVSLPDFVTAQALIDLHLSQWQRELKSQPVNTEQESYIQELAPLVERLGFSDFLGTKIGHLSSGNLQKLRLILALMRPSQILLLDEACSAMDSRSQQVFYQLIDEYQGQVIAISHEKEAFGSEFQLVNLSK